MKARNGQVYDGEWQLLSVDPFTGVRKWISAEPLPGDGTRYIVKTETPVEGTQALLDANRRELLDSNGKKWGEGRVAWRMPIDEFYRSGVAEARKNEDDKWVKRYFNDPDHQAFRTFKGKL